MSTHLVSCLALYQHRQDQAIGINWLSARTRNLLFYYNKLQQDSLSKLMTAAYLNGIIQQGAKEIKELVIKAETAENKQEILQQVIELQKSIEKAKEVLDELEETVTAK